MTLKFEIYLLCFKQDNDASHHTSNITLLEIFFSFYFTFSLIIKRNDRPVTKLKLIVLSTSLGVLPP